MIYVGTFSKVMFPALRLGYMVLPEGLVAAFRSCNMRFYRESDYAVQAALAAFITQGHLARHVRRMRELYPIRQGLLREVLQR
ncbi:aminotransferase class I/II-fold pyridoxal phosphate-dependent enzyme, partial [Gulbenkiania mobilis]|uniref:aminotransferase class I/II-fold pyridoxal phosphate-dependent enzyme n=1 Tax=Gulbenkiania mobilis TaxID=397457 RepID=UPI001F1FC25A